MYSKTSLKKRKLLKTCPKTLSQLKNNSSLMNRPKPKRLSTPSLSKITSKPIKTSHQSQNFMILTQGMIIQNKMLMKHGKKSFKL
jgi:hypothetical protein